MRTIGQIVQVKYGSQDITDHVISYERSQKMCTSVDTLNIVLSPDCGQSLHPWDVIKIYEDGGLKGTYYINDGGLQQPDGSFIVAGQDNSKRLVDYFIVDEYKIDYQTDSRYWIEKFLTEVGVEYEFTTDSYGSLLSNNTVLGRMSAYEQILYLLQISCWFMYFNHTGTAIIGEIEPDLSQPKGTAGLSFLTAAKIIKHDGMLRNRVVVWGATDPITSGTIFSDVSTITPWNYDDADLRAIVIANSYIPTQAAADGIAIEALNAFAKITVEKHLELAGERNWHIGDPVRALGGVGVVTTQGAVFSATTGYRSKFVLDERCPRLYAYWNPGGYVYIGTETSGVWRKHLLQDPVWSSYCSGLPSGDFGISDLFVMGDTKSIVCMSGNAYYDPGIGFDSASGYIMNDVSGSGGYWGQIIIPPLETFDGSGFPYIVESGIKSRAVIHDKISNNIRILVDTYSGDNYPCYSDLVSGFVFNSTVSLSGGIWVVDRGINNLSGCRTWVLDYSPSGIVASGESPIYDPFSVDTFSGVVLVSSYPVYFPAIDPSGFTYSCWDCRGIDIENDGKNDFISIVIPPYIKPIYAYPEKIEFLGYYRYPMGNEYLGIRDIYIKIKFPLITVTTVGEERTIGERQHAWIQRVKVFYALPQLIYVNAQPIGYEVISEVVTNFNDYPWHAYWDPLETLTRPILYPYTPFALEPVTGHGLWVYDYGIWIPQEGNPAQGSFGENGGVYANQNGYGDDPFYVDLYWDIPQFATPSGYYSQCRVFRRDIIESGQMLSGLMVSGFPFTEIISGMYPLRLDISSVSPLITIQDIGSTFNTFYSTPGGITQITPSAGIPGLGTDVYDFRYASFTAAASGMSLSGYKNIIFTTQSGFNSTSSILLTPTDLYNSPVDASILTSGIPIVLSGAPDMIETSNFAFPNQYVFVSTSGEPNPSGNSYRFYQKNPSGFISSGVQFGLSGGFVEYPSGLPNSRITIIRLEDLI